MAGSPSSSSKGREQAYYYVLKKRNQGGGVLTFPSYFQAAEEEITFIEILEKGFEWFARTISENQRKKVTTKTLETIQTNIEKVQQAPFFSPELKQKYLSQLLQLEKDAEKELMQNVKNSIQKLLDFIKHISDNMENKNLNYETFSLQNILKSIEELLNNLEKYMLPELLIKFKNDKIKPFQKVVTAYFLVQVKADETLVQLLKKETTPDSSIEDSINRLNEAFQNASEYQQKTSEQSFQNLLKKLENKKKESENVEIYEKLFREAESILQLEGEKSNDEVQKFKVKLNKSFADLSEEDKTKNAATNIELNGRLDSLQRMKLSISDQNLYVIKEGKSTYYIGKFTDTKNFQLITIDNSKETGEIIDSGEAQEWGETYYDQKKKIKIVNGNIGYQDNKQFLVYEKYNQGTLVVDNEGKLYILDRTVPSAKDTTFKTQLKENVHLKQEFKNLKKRHKKQSKLPKFYTVTPIDKTETKDWELKFTNEIVPISKQGHEFNTKQKKTITALKTYLSTIQKATQTSSQKKRRKKED